MKKKTKKILKSALSLFLVCLCIASVAAMSPKSSASSTTCIAGWEKTTYYDPSGVSYSLCSGYHWNGSELVKVHDVLYGDLVAPLVYYEYGYYDEDENYVYHMRPSNLVISCEGYDNCPKSLVVKGASDCSFSYCENLETVDISAVGFFLDGKHMGGQISFDNCPKLQELDLTTGREIRVVDCNGLKEFSYNNSSEVKKDVTIENCSALGEVNVDSQVDYFYLANCPALTYLTMDDGVEEYIIKDCNNIAYAKLSRMDIPDSIFEGNTKIKTVIIPEGVTSIGSYAFRNCTSLKSIDIPASVTTIGIQTFSFSGIESINFAGTKDQWKEITKTFYYDVFPNGTIVNCQDGIYDLCSCKCHNGSFMKFIYKVISTILNLFGLDSQCECGWTHSY